MARFKYATGGGGGNAGAWNNLTSSDVTTNNGGYTTFSITSSEQADYNIRVSIDCDLLVTSGTFPINTAATIYYDTGISKADLSNGDGRWIGIQTMLEMYNITPSSDYVTDTTHEHAIAPFVTTSTSFPMTAGDKGFFWGATWRGGAGKYFGNRILKNTATSSDAGVLYNAGANDLLALGNELTVFQSNVGSTQGMALYRYDSSGFWDNGGTDSALFLFNQTTHNGSDQNLTGTETIKVGVAFHMLKTQDAAVTKTWDINLKWRKLVSP